MPLVMCPLCADDEYTHVLQDLPDGRTLVECRPCNYQWPHGQPRHQPQQQGLPFEQLKGRFPKPEDVAARWAEHANRLKEQFLTRHPHHDPKVAVYWAKYQQVFSRDGLWECDPQDLKDFANVDTGAHPGNMSVFNTAWNDMGTEAAAEATRRSIAYLLYGPEDLPLEDRLQKLLTGSLPFSMTGFKEALLTKVLCVMQPDRFVSILKYTTEAGGKRQIARLVYGLELPAPETVNWTLGRLISWSNDLLRDLAGIEFTNQQHASDFLWWAKDQPGGPS